MQRAIPRHFTAYSLTALFYIGVIGVFYYFNTVNHIKADAPKKIEVHRIEMTLSTFVEEIVPPAEIVEEVKKVEEKVVEKIIEPLPPIIENPKSKPILKKKIIKKKVVKKKSIVKKKVIKKKVIKKASQPKGKASTKTKNRQERNQKRQASSTQKKNFWAKIRRKIEKQKYYPRIAKKRGIEGIVKVKFTILASGKVSNISVSGSKLFHASAKEAVQNAFPISSKNLPITLPKSVTLPLHYKIR